MHISVPVCVRVFLRLSSVQSLCPSNLMPSPHSTKNADRSGVK